MAKRYVKKGGKRVFKKKGYKKRKQTITNVNKSLAPIPARYITKMKYSDVASTSAGNTSWRFNLNSVFDPNRTGTGHQPYGFDQLAALYNRYRVIATSYTITCSSTTAPIRYAVIPCNESKTFGSLSEICENPRSRFMLQNPGGPLRQIHGKTYLPALVGRTKAQYMADDRYQAITSADPAELAVLHIAAATIGDTFQAVDLCITMEFLVEFFDLNPLAQS